MSDYPLTLAGAHGRIDAYRAALTHVEGALADAYPYVNGVMLDRGNSPWRRETAETTLKAIIEARTRIAGELAVSVP